MAQLISQRSNISNMHPFALLFYKGRVTQAAQSGCKMQERCVSRA